MGFALAQLKGWLDFVPDPIVGFLIVAPLLYLIYHFWTHERVKERRHLVYTYPRMSFAVLVTVGALIGGALGAFAWWTTFRQGSPSESTEARTTSTPEEITLPQPSPSPPKPQTLKERFVSDFSGRVFVYEDEEDAVFFAPDNDKPLKLTITKRALFDLNTHSKFVGFYIPLTPYTYGLCRELSKYVEKVLANAERHLSAEYRSLGEKPMNIENMRFSGRVFIYHETPLTEKEETAIEAIYKTKGLAPQLRGPEYEAAKNLYDAQPKAPPSQ